MLINFGVVLGVGSYYVQSQSISIEAFFATLPCGIMLFSMIIINEIPDIVEDKNAGKLTLIARYGNQIGINLYVISWICTYFVIFIGAILSILPKYILLTYLSIPLTYRSIKTLKKYSQNLKKIHPANLDMIKSHNLTSIIIIVVYCINGFYNGSTLLNLLPFVILFFVFYFPAGISIFKPNQ
jgi:1,4-dihydroxy-2-naphthoate octaprenyltransferase